MKWNRATIGSRRGGGKREKTSPGNRGEVISRSDCHLVIKARTGKDYLSRPRRVLSARQVRGIDARRRRLGGGRFRFLGPLAIFRSFSTVSATTRACEIVIILIRDPVHVFPIIHSLRAGIVSIKFIFLSHSGKYYLILPAVSFYIRL